MSEDPRTSRPPLKELADHRERCSHAFLQQPFLAGLLHAVHPSKVPSFLALSTYYIFQLTPTQSVGFRSGNGFLERSPPLL